MREVKNELGMNKSSIFFDELRKAVDTFGNMPERDNEASRHDQLIYPILTSTYGLGWKKSDIISQDTIVVPYIIKESHIFRNSIPKIRKPDLIICPTEIIKHIAVIEEKKRQQNIESLKQHRLQLSEYQALYECNWGILTDGEKWIIKKGFDTVLEFTSIDEIEKNIKEFCSILGQSSTMDRFIKFKTFDLIIISDLQNNDQSENIFYNIPVIIVGLLNGKISKSGMGFQKFRNFGEALKYYPDLSITEHTKRFAQGTKEKYKNGNFKRLRFETWEAFEFYSS